VILDTNALSAFVDGDRALGARLSDEEHLAIPVIVLGEFRYGISTSRYRRRYEDWLNEHLADFDVLGVTESTAVEYARLRAALKKIGRPIPANDAWIAALAVQHRQSIVSRDEHFDAVPGLQRESW
jgi:tRNA(fMet)-specific endonuclease VapC